MTPPKSAIVLLSGGLDSTTTLAMAQQQGYDCYALSFDYGQRHVAELNAARRLAKSMRVAAHKIVPLSLDAIGGSALTDRAIKVPEAAEEGIPITYVPARNTVFLAIALGWAEVIHARDLFVGVNAVDYSGYPDCRPAFIHAFEQLANLATKAGVEGTRFQVHAPLIKMTKADIIQAGHKLGVDYYQTVSCYQADEQGRACGRCDSCRFRQQGFKAAGLPDMTNYKIKSVDAFARQGNAMRQAAKELVYDYMKAQSQCQPEGLGLRTAHIFRACGLDWGDYPKSSSSSQQYWLVATLQELTREGRIERISDSGPWRLKENL